MKCSKTMTNRIFFLMKSLKNVIFERYFIETHMEKTQVGWIIHLFALLHAAVALTCRVAGVEDELLLTILTMTMTLLICVKKGFKAEFSAACVIVVNIIGYLLGNVGAAIFSRIMGSSLFINALSTALTTEILGWSIVAFSKIIQKERNEPAAMSSRFLKWIMLVMGSVFALRIGIITLEDSTMFSTENMIYATTRLLTNSFALITMLCLNIMYVRLSGRFLYGKSSVFAIAAICSFMIVCTLVGAVLGCMGISFQLTVVSWVEFFQMVIVAFIAQITLYCIVYMVNYTISAGSKVKEEKEKKHVAQYRYQKLKRQVDPHFLFNSLNVLDCLVWEAPKEMVSTYIHKLAGIYRYMIRSEEDELVQMRDELTFVEMYVDLLKVRFPEGFEVIVDVPQEDQARFVLPCSLQLLIENVTKHNAVGSDTLLTIRVESDGEHVRVSNNKVPKVTRTQSTGLGHKYIRQQYLDISGKEIRIENTDKEYTVTLPLL